MRTTVTGSQSFGGISGLLGRKVTHVLHRTFLISTESSSTFVTQIVRTTRKMRTTHFSTASLSRHLASFGGISGLPGRKVTQVLHRTFLNSKESSSTFVTQNDSDPFWRAGIMQSMGLLRTTFCSFPGAAAPFTPTLHTVPPLCARAPQRKSSYQNDLLKFNLD